MADVLKLVVPTGKVSGNEGFASDLRAFADEIEEGCWGEVTTILSIVEYDGGHTGRKVMTSAPLDTARAVGLLVFAANKLMNSD